MKGKVRVRFAPSPTGHLHLGSARTALFNWLFARHHNGTFSLRIEDTDRVRSKKEYVDSILSSLDWLGIVADEPHVYQTSLLKHHKEALAKLLESGNAYPCFCQISHDDVIGYKYPGTCRDKVLQEKYEEGSFTIRFRLPDDLKRIVFNDEIHGTIVVHSDQLDDFIIARSDGSPTYNFCVVVDDISMKITHIIRGQDHISNTPKQILLYNALGVEHIPVFAHIPLILGENGARLSKRDAATAVDEYKNTGILPDALCNYLVRLGWAHGDQEIFTKEELIELFSLRGVGKKSALFDYNKLLWVNSVYIKNMSIIDFKKSIEQNNSLDENKLTLFFDHEQVRMLFELYKERCHTINEIFNEIVLLSHTPAFRTIEIPEELYQHQIINLLSLIYEYLQTCTREPEQDEIKERIKELAKEHQVKLATVAQALRFALIGRCEGPNVFALLSILGTVESGKRIHALSCSIKSM